MSAKKTKGSKNEAGGSEQRTSIVAFAIFLAAATVLLYLPTAGFGFVDYDDTDYTLDNPHVSSGLRLENVTWALQESYAANWHPLTWLSHMVDCQLFGCSPGPSHAVNAVLHAANSVLVFLVFFRMTGFLWRSWIVAALFAFHPLHVESVAWIAERKDVLSTFFFFLAVLAYVSFVQESRAAPYRKKSALTSYALAVLAFICALFSKPMVVTFPFVLLLLDYWPLQRREFRTAQQAESRQLGEPEIKSPQHVSLASLLWEKLPFFIIAAGVSVVTYLAQKSGGAVASLDSTPLGDRLANAVVSYCRYLGKTFWPRDLFIPYVPELDESAATPWIAATALAVIAFAVFKGRRWKYIPFGWFWYLGTLVPVIGILKVGSQTMADRYTYIPSIGLFVMATWGCAEVFLRCKSPRGMVRAFSVAALCACALLGFRQVGYWRNGETLFLHTIKKDPTNLVALSCLAATYATNPDPKVRNGEKAVRLACFCVDQTHRAEPGYLDLLSTAYAEAGQFQLALQTAEETLRLPATSAQPFFLSQVKKHIELYKSGKAVRSQG